MNTGVYRKIEGRTGVGMLYEFCCLTRNHTTGAESVVYIPLRVEPEWAGTVRHCDIPRAEFERKFEYVGEGLPGKALSPQRTVTHAPVMCPAGHGLMRYAIEDDRLHCGTCHAVATTHGNIIVDPDPVETKRG